MNNKTIWITGASSGIGKALAIKFSQEGWKVAISARREKLLEEISKSQKNIDYFPLDVTDSEKCKIVFNEVKKKWVILIFLFFVQVSTILIQKKN